MPLLVLLSVNSGVMPCFNRSCCTRSSVAFQNQPGFCLHAVRRANSKCWVAIFVCPSLCCSVPAAATTSLAVGESGRSLFSAWGVGFPRQVASSSFNSLTRFGFSGKTEVEKRRVFQQETLQDMLRFDISGTRFTRIVHRIEDHATSPRRVPFKK